MKVAVRNITSEGIEFDRVVEPSEIGLEEHDLDLKKPLKVHARIERVNNFVLVRADIKTVYEYTCARCLEPFIKDRTSEFEFEYELEKGVEDINYGEDIRQELILSRTQRELCRPDCRGICAGCGVNLNLDQCQCKVK